MPLLLDKIIIYCLPWVCICVWKCTFECEFQSVGVGNRENVQKNQSWYIWPMNITAVLSPQTIILTLKGFLPRFTPGPRQTARHEILDYARSGQICTEVKCYSIVIHQRVLWWIQTRMSKKVPECENRNLRMKSAIRCVNMHKKQALCVTHTMQVSWQP